MTDVGMDRELDFTLARAAATLALARDIRCDLEARYVEVAPGRLWRR